MIAKPTGTFAAELSQTGDKRWIGPLDREDPEINEMVRLPRQHSAVAQTASQLEEESFLAMITRTITALHEWLVGPPSSALERVRRDIADHSNYSLYYGSMSF